MQKKYSYTLKNVEETLKLKTWWAALAILPAARRVTLFVANNTDIRPNTITLISFFMRVIVAAFFWDGQRISLIAGAFIFEGAYILDCVDGSIARLKDQSSTIGAFLDHLLDTLGVTISLIALAVGARLLDTSLGISVIVLYIFVHYMTFVAATIFAAERNRIGENKSETVLDKNALSGEKSALLREIGAVVVNYRNIFSKRRFKAFISPPDVEAVVLFIFPVLGLVELGFKVGLFMLIAILVYKVASYLYVIKANASTEDVA